MAVGRWWSAVVTLWALVALSTSANAAVTAVVSTPGGDGYWLVSSDGAVVARGAAGWHEDLAGHPLNKPISAIHSAVDGGGYRIIGRDGGVFAFGSASYQGSLGGIPLNGEIVAGVPSPSGNGYRLVGADGGVFNFGDSTALDPGSLGASPPPPSGAIVGVAQTPSGQGYWLAGRDGHVYRFGDAALLPDAGGMPLNKPIVGIAGHGSDGYWLLAGDGGLFAYGSAPFLGSLGGRTLTADAVAIAATPGTPGGYRIALADGSVFAFEKSGVVSEPPAGQFTTPAQPPTNVTGTKPPQGLRRLSRWPVATILVTWVRRDGRRRLRSVDRVRVENLSRGVTVRLICSSGSRPCPFARSTRRIAGRSGIVTFAARRSLRQATLKVLVTQRSRLGSYTSWRVRRGQLLSRIDRDRRRACVLHGSTRPIACGS